jgi:hypothetical protein
MMGRDDIPVGVGGDGGISDSGTIYPDVGGYLPLIDQVQFFCPTFHSKIVIQMRLASIYLSLKKNIVF